MNNADFFIYLAEKGLSFAPHTPKRHSDRIGLYRAICWSIRYNKIETFPYEKIPDSQLVLIKSEHDCPMFFKRNPERPFVSIVAKCRIWQYFAPILSDNDKGWTALLLD